MDCYEADRLWDSVTALRRAARDVPRIEERFFEGMVVPKSCFEAFF